MYVGGLGGLGVVELGLPDTWLEDAAQTMYRSVDATGALPGNEQGELWATRWIQARFPGTSYADAYGYAGLVVRRFAELWAAGNPPMPVAPQPRTLEVDLRVVRNPNGVPGLYNLVGERRVLDGVPQPWQVLPDVVYNVREVELAPGAPYLRQYGGVYRVRQVEIVQEIPGQQPLPPDQKGPSGVATPPVPAVPVPLPGEPSRPLPPDRVPLPVERPMTPVPSGGPRTPLLVGDQAENVIAPATRRSPLSSVGILAVAGLGLALLVMRRRGR